MRILHTSDWHLGISIHNVSMYEQQKHFKEVLISIIKEENIDVVALAGDVFDSSVSNSESILLYNDIVTEICLELKVSMVVISGNHDGAARLASMRDLLKASGMHVSGKLTNTIQPISFNDTDFYLIPYFNIEEVRYLYPDKEIRSYEDAMITVCDSIRCNMDTNKVNIILSHSFVSGAQLSDSERSASVGTVNMISKDVFKEFSYVALGHIHRKQRLAENVYYSGSPLKYSVNEANQKKYVLVYDTETKMVQEIEVIPLRDILIVEDTYDEIMRNEGCDDYVKVIVTDRYSGIDMIEGFRSLFPNLIAVEGKSVDGNMSLTSLTMEEVRKMKPAELIDKFFEENFKCEMESRQLQEFLSMLEKTEEGEMQ